MQAKLESLGFKKLNQYCNPSHGFVVRFYVIANKYVYVHVSMYSRAGGNKFLTYRKTGLIKHLPLPIQRLVEDKLPYIEPWQITQWVNLVHDKPRKEAIRQLIAESGYIEIKKACEP